MFGFSVRQIEHVYLGIYSYTVFTHDSLHCCASNAMIGGVKYPDNMLLEKYIT